MPNTLTTDDDGQAGETLLLGGRVRLLQRKSGYRAGMDAALLAASIDGKPGERVLEAGCGVGAALLQAARRAPQTRFTGIERDPAALDLARRNIALNGMSGAVETLSGNIGSGFKSLHSPPFDAAFANPPFFDDPTGLRGPHPDKKGAWLADGGLEAWTGFLLKAVREGGRIIVIHRADRMADLLALIGQGAGSFRIRPVQPFADAPAKRVLVQAIKTGRAPLVLLPPLVLHERGGAKHTAEADAILRGQASLNWGDRPT